MHRLCWTQRDYYSECHLQSLSPLWLVVWIFHLQHPQILLPPFQCISWACQLSLFHNLLIVASSHKGLKLALSESLREQPSVPSHDPSWSVHTVSSFLSLLSSFQNKIWTPPFTFTPQYEALVDPLDGSLPISHSTNILFSKRMNFGTAPMAPFCLKT